jgi:3-phosphoglycerate kinase
MLKKKSLFWGGEILLENIRQEKEEGKEEEKKDE